MTCTPAAAQAVASGVGRPGGDDLPDVTQASDVIITVVTDDRAMKKIYPAAC